MIDCRGNAKGNTEADGLRWIDHFSREKSSPGIKVFLTSLDVACNLVLFSLHKNLDSFSLSPFLCCRNTELQNTCQTQ
jgi:hypothetical protein